MHTTFVCMSWGCIHILSVVTLNCKRNKSTQSEVNLKLIEDCAVELYLKLLDEQRVSNSLLQENISVLEKGTKDWEIKI